MFDRVDLSSFIHHNILDAALHTGLVFSLMFNIMTVFIFEDVLSLLERMELVCFGFQFRICSSSLTVENHWR